MTYALLGLLYSTFGSLFLLLGVGTAINKSGEFFKVLEVEDDDNFKRAFDKVTSDLANDFNNSFESINIIASNISKIWLLFWELMIGEKFIKKTKDGKIIVDDKNVVFDGYKNKIANLNSKIKDYKKLLKDSGNEVESESDNDSDENSELIEEIDADN